MKNLESLESQISIATERLRKLEDRKKMLFQQQLAGMKAELKEKWDDVQTLMESIRQHEPDFASPWPSATMDSLRVYKVKNVRDAIIAVATFTPMASTDLVNAVNERFGTTYSKATIRQGLSAIIFSRYNPASANHLKYVDDNGFTLERTNGTRAGYSSYFYKKVKA